MDKNTIGQCSNEYARKHIDSVNTENHFHEKDRCCDYLLEDFKHLLHALISLAMGGALGYYSFKFIWLP